jgi:hypothetical protein
MNPRETRGFFNCNPGNMDRGMPPWNGELAIGDPRITGAAPGDTPQLVAEAIQVRMSELKYGRFCVFADAEHGIRALVHNLWAYHDRLGCRSIRDYINRWAPPNENNTASYIARVAEHAGVSPDDGSIDIRQAAIFQAIGEGIINVECAGMPYDQATLERGWTLASMPAEPPKAGAILLPPRLLMIGLPGGEDVRQLDRRLAELGLLAANDVGPEFTKDTRDAVIAFQRSKGLVPDGVVGPLTRAALAA